MSSKINLSEARAQSSDLITSIASKDNKPNTSNIALGLKKRQYSNSKMIYVSKWKVGPFLQVLLWILMSKFIKYAEVKCKPLLS